MVSLHVSVCQLLQLRRVLPPPPRLVGRTAQAAKTMEANLMMVVRMCECGVCAYESIIQTNSRSFRASVVSLASASTQVLALVSAKYVVILFCLPVHFVSFIFLCSRYFSACVCTLAYIYSRLYLLLMYFTYYIFSILRYLWCHWCGK